jgi:hypothetical protein
MAKKKKKNPYLTIRRKWDRKPETQVLPNKKKYKRKKKFDLEV